MRDLFGNDLAEEFGRSGALGEGERQRLRRRAQSVPRGYAAPPGSGPSGMTCRTCKHKRPSSFGTVKTYYKCGLIKPTRGSGTDIRLRSPACKRYEANDGG